MIQFYAPDIETTLTLPESDSGHCVKVLRRQKGDIIEVVDGRGCRFKCRITEPHPKHTRVEIVERETVSRNWPVNITVAVAPTKHMDRMEWMVEKLVEMGVDRIVPLCCRYSERKEIKVERLEKIAIAAMKQSLKAASPVIDEMTPIKKFIDNAPSGLKFIAYCGREIERRLLSREYPGGEDVTIMIGPEGDFFEAEVETARRAGFVAVSLGESRLRTETAAVVACDTIHVINQINNLEQ